MRISPRFTGILLALLFLAKVISSAPVRNGQAGRPTQKAWVDSVYNSLSEDERIGQLFMVAAYSGGKNYDKDLIIKLIGAHQVGGLIFMQGGPVRQALLTNEYQHMANVPLLIAMDAEWGLGMRLDSIRNMPRQMMLGATRDTDLVFQMGAAVAAQCKRLGVQMDFAPVIDVNNNANNPVINSRSFGQDKTWVARLGLAYMNGLQRNGVMACAKHFPGHGDTNVDSHKDLPLIPKTLEQLDSLELYPFKNLIFGGVKSIMVAHLEVPAIDTTVHVPTSLSGNAVTNLLKNRLGFQGLVVTDALGMQGVAKYFPAGEADVRAFEAGNDILLFPSDVPTAIARIRSAVDSNVALKLALENSVKKILAAKYETGLYAFKNIDTAHIAADINRMTDEIRTKVAVDAVTVVKDGNKILNKLAASARLAYIGLDAATPTPLYQQLVKTYPAMQPIWLAKNGDKDSLKIVADLLSNYDAVIVGVHNINFSPGNNYGLSEALIKFLDGAGKRNNTLLVAMGNAYALQYFPDARSVMAAYEDDSITELAIADVICKNKMARGVLPVSAAAPATHETKPVSESGSVCKNPDVALQKVARPELAGVIDTTQLGRLDHFIQQCVSEGVFPGCRVLAARDGKILYDKSFGYQTYTKKLKVDSNTLYDMASCTKMVATTLAVMHLYEQKKLELDKTIGDYLPAARGTNKAGIKIKDLLCHQAGLRSWIPFYKETLDGKGRPDKKIYKKKASKTYSVQVAKNLYMRNDWVDTMWSRIYTSAIENAGKSVYSDLDYIFLGAIVEQIKGEKLDKYVENEFYKPMGLKHIVYKPQGKFALNQIAPTEQDAAFRQQLIQGYVHDPGAAMFGGVAGHAGIFATAHDVATVMQMLLNGGVYNGKRLFDPATIAAFTAYQSVLNHRGLGFDKPSTGTADGGPASANCSGYAFGHQGFTGTCAWADPATGIVFVFLSNRVNPTADNSKINSMNVRTHAQDLIYDALGIPVNTGREYIYRAQVPAH